MREVAAEEVRPWDQPKLGVLSPDPTAAPPVKTPLRPSGREKRVAGGGTGGEGARSLPAARLYAAGRCRRLQYRRPETAPRSRKEAAMLPPPRLPAVTSAAPGSPTDCKCAPRSGRDPPRRGAARARALQLGAGTHPRGEERDAERRGRARQGSSVRLRIVNQTNQDSQVSALR